MDLLVVLFLGVGAYLLYKTFAKEEASPELPAETGVDTSVPVKGEGELKKLTKVQIEEAAREHGVELDRRKTKDNMIKDYLDQVKN